MDDTVTVRRNITVLTAAQALGGSSAPIVMSLGGLVGLRDEVRGPLAADLQVLDLAEVAPQLAARLARGFLHHADEAGYGCHGA